MTSTPDPNAGTARHPRPRGGRRVLLAYTVVVGSLALGLPALVAGWIGADRCTGGLECLGWFVYGMVGMGLIALVALLLLGRRLRLGIWWALLTVVLVAAPLALADTAPFRLLALLGPGIAAWVSQPVVPDAGELPPLGPPASAPDPVRTWLPRWATALIVAVIVPLLSRLTP